MIRVLLAEDHHVVREAVASRLGREHDMEVIGQVAEGGEVLLTAVAHKKPDVLLLDARMPGPRIIDAARTIHQNWPEIAILVLSQYNRREYVVGFLEAGVRGYVLKDDSMEMLVQAIRAVAQSVEWLSPRVRALYKQVQSANNLAQELTQREVQVLQLIVNGYSNAAIAKELVLSVQTVKNYVRQIKAKLGVKSRVEIVLFAIQHGLADPPDDVLPNIPDE